MKYRKKPVVIEAVQIPLNQKDECPVWLIRAGAEGRVWIESDGLTRIKTLEGVMTATHGDWIIQGVKGEIYPCKPEIFEMTYEPADSQPVKVAEEFYCCKDQDNPCHPIRDYCSRGLPPAEKLTMVANENHICSTGTGDENGICRTCGISLYGPPAEKLTGTGEKPC